MFLLQYNFTHRRRRHHIIIIEEVEVHKSEEVIFEIDRSPVQRSERVVVVTPRAIYSIIAVFGECTCRATNVRPKGWNEQNDRF